MPRAERSAWETRFDWILAVLMIGSYALAVFQSALSENTGVELVVAAVVTGAYVLVMQTVPRKWRNVGVPGEVLAITGVVATLTAVYLTDAGNPGYVLMVSVPIFFASAFMGFRVGIEVALLASFGYLAIVIVKGLPFLDAVQAVAFYLLMGAAFAQARRILVVEREESAAALRASQLDIERLDRLEEAHSLLVELAEVAGTNELSPSTVGEAALLDLAARLPIAGGEVSMNGDDGPVSTWGHRSSNGAGPAEYPLISGGRPVGMVHLWPVDGMDLAQHKDDIDSSLSGVALAFDNIKMLGTVARRSVQDERSRVARELHDDIGPALASLGLVVDVMVQTRTDPGLTPELRKLRGEITDLVERVRATVADLRRADTTTVMDHVHRIVTELGDDAPRVVVAIDERSAADGATAAEVGSVLVEAVRNAARHSEATQIRIEGIVDGANGELAVVDNGHGFDPQLAYAGHFGLVGMQERAVAIGGDLSISSRPGAGTRVTVTWGDDTR